MKRSVAILSLSWLFFLSPWLASARWLSRRELPSETKPEDGKGYYTISGLRYIDRRQTLMTQLTIGTPPQHVWLAPDFDAGWIPMPLGLVSGKEEDLDCSDPRISQSLCFIRDVTGTYNPQDSTSYVNNTNDRDPERQPLYFGGTPLDQLPIDQREFVYYEYAKEVISFGDSPQLNNTQLWLGRNYTNKTPTFFIGLAQSSSYASIPQVLFRRRHIFQTALSIYMNDYRTNESEIQFGGVDRAKYKGPLTVLQAINGADRVIPLGVAMIFNTTGSEIGPISLSELNALLDFTKSEIGFVTPLASKFIQYLNRSFAITESHQNNGEILYLTPCSNRDSSYELLFWFKIADNGTSTVIKVQPSSFIIPYVNAHGSPVPVPGDGSPSCRVLINPFNKSQAAGTSSYDVILGAPFARAAYTVYDLENKEYGIAPAILNATKSDVVPLELGGMQFTLGLDIAGVTKPRFY